ncbi:hypothetical protein JW948_02565 [bacterium]|nr:hypothetical protein [bacterium]
MNTPEVSSQNQKDELECVHDLFQKSFSDATRSIMEIVGHKMTVSQFTIRFLDGEEFVNQIEDERENTYFASMMKISTPIHAQTVFLITEKDGRQLYSSVTNNGEKSRVLISDEMIRGIGEINNMVGSAFINCLADLLRRTIHNTVPMNTFDMLGPILQSVVMQEGIPPKEILVADALIHEEDEQSFHIRLFVLTERHALQNAISQAEES